MAIGTLTPSIRVCTTNQCATIKVYDNTLAYNVSSNTGGWGATNTTTSTLTAATLQYTTPSGDSTTIDILTTVQDVITVTNEFLIATLSITPEDGEYTYLYTLTNEDGTVTKSLTNFNMCVSRCCVDKLWAKAAQEDGECGCAGGATSYSKKAMQAEAMYQSIVKGTSCASSSTRDSLLLKLQRICKLENCNCG